MIFVNFLFFQVAWLTKGLLVALDLYPSNCPHYNIALLHHKLTQVHSHSHSRRGLNFQLTLSKLTFLTCTLHCGVHSVRSQCSSSWSSLWQVAFGITGNTQLDWPYMTSSPFIVSMYMHVYVIDPFPPWCHALNLAHSVDPLNLAYSVDPLNLAHSVDPLNLAYIFSWPTEPSSFSWPPEPSLYIQLTHWT